MNKILLTLSLLVSCIQAKAQLTINYTSATVAANTLIGQGVTVSNATFSGSGLQLASFGGGSQYFDFESGIILTTGDAEFATKNNTNNVCDNSPLPTPTLDSDPDLGMISNSLRDVGVLEFDLITTGSLLEFEFIFASEEYLEFVNSNFNDIFGFFISGPGINGPFSNNAKNIAMVPGTSDYISINTVNHITNSQYFNDNFGPGHWGPGTLTYDGFTNTISASCPVQCGQTYHLRIAIANVLDHNCDSGVMLKRGSVRSNFVPGQITANGPYCEGQTINLAIQGSSDWTYSWSSGQSGVGLNNISVIADLATTDYAVTITSPDNCTIIETITVDVHSQNNNPPITTGVNGSGIFTFYAQADNGTVCFDIPTQDAASELVTILANSLPANATFTHAGSPHETGTFCWTPGIDDIGIHTFNVVLNDNNVCGSLSSTYTFTVNIVCDFCPVGIYYQNRQPNNNPLPAETQAGQFIVAGEAVDFNQTLGVVETGTASVLFEAGEFISLQPGFTGGPNFTAQITPNACVDECTSCCENWSGFTQDALPNVFTPNGDGINDFWYVPDVDNPFCAFNAQGFSLIIKTPSGSTAYTLESTQTDHCCPFEAPASNHNIPHSSIFWDGIINSGIFAGTPATDGTYFYVLTLTGCTGEQSFSGNITLLGSQARAAKRTPSDFKESVPEPELTVYPNPANDKITIAFNQSNGTDSGTVDVVSLRGRILMTMPINNTSMSLNISTLPQGSYFVRVTLASGIHTEIFVKN